MSCRLFTHIYVYMLTMYKRKNNNNNNNHNYIKNEVKMGDSRQSLSIDWQTSI